MPPHNTSPHHQDTGNRDTVHLLNKAMDNPDTDSRADTTKDTVNQADTTKDTVALHQPRKNPHQT